MRFSVLNCDTDENTHIFYEDLLPIVVGVNKSKKLMMNQSISEWSTPFEEALACWIIENNNDKWIAEIEAEVAKETDITLVDPRPMQYINSTTNKMNDYSMDDTVSSTTSNDKSIQSKYTYNKSGNAKYRSWSKDGIRKYNEILLKVKKQRQHKDGIAYEVGFQNALFITKYGANGSMLSDSETSAKEDEEDKDHDVLILSGIGSKGSNTDFNEDENKEKPKCSGDILSYESSSQEFVIEPTTQMRDNLDDKFEAAFNNNNTEDEDSEEAMIHSQVPFKMPNIGISIPNITTNLDDTENNEKNKKFDDTTLKKNQKQVSTTNVTTTSRKRSVSSTTSRQERVTRKRVLSRTPIGGRTRARTNTYK